ncbi:hypothetical protein NMQ03_16435 [Arthrobacter sp. DNA4]|uniref:hypothetical protein n=1 Tax=Arthrobacter sp. DNA4 TaxID=2963432 RepID=UPI0020CEBE73|nr:hypothetical protein [Arthrobacter sp. DNA4]UTT68795.1 hypothetical protein NMQ03_16435 [Arthrobacter sp. DNA4]
MKIDEDKRQVSKSISVKVFGGTVALAFVSVGFMLPGIVRTKLASLVFGAHGVAFVGQLSQVQTVLISLGAAGIVTATRVILARRNIPEGRLQAAQNWLLLVPTGAAVFFGFVVAIFSAPIASLVLGSERYYPLVIAAAAGIPPAVFGQISLAIAQVRSNRSRLVAAAIMSALVGGLSVAGLLLLHDEFWASLSFLVAPAAQAIVISAVCSEARLSFRERPRLPRESLREVLSLAWSSALLGIFAAAAELAYRSVVVQRFGLEALAAYQPVVLLVTQLVGMLLSALATSSLIETAKITDRVHLAEKLDELTVRLVPFIGGMLAVLSGTAPLLIVIFYSPDLVKAALPLVTLALAGEVTRAYAWTLGSCLLPQGLRGSWLVNGVVTVAIQLVTSIFAGYNWGPIGLVSGLLAGNIFSAIFTMVIVKRAGIAVRTRGLLVVVVVAVVLAILSRIGMSPINFVSIAFGIALVACSKYLPQKKSES